MNGEWNAPSDVSDAIASAVEAAEKKVGTHIKEVYVGVPGEFVRVYVIESSVALQGADPKVTSADVEKLQRQATEMLDRPTGVIIHRSPAWFKVDGGQKTLEPVDQKGSMLEGMIGFVLADQFFINDVTEKQKQDNTIRQENKELRERLKARCSGDIVGNSPQITAVFDLIAKAAAVDDNVVVYGESGTGKELAARAIHDGSSRYQQPFVAVNCGAIPESLFESELFGYKKGAFTGATADKKGYLDQADGGTLFLDELGEISLMGQVKLLRAIEHGGFTPVGGAQIHRPDVRIIAATNRDLLERVNEGAMRRDFYYRIHVIPIHLPPLRERKADIPLLVEHFLKAYPSNKRFEYMDSEMLHAFMLYDWPGNVRELQNVLYQYLSLGTARLGDTVIGETTAQAAASEAPEDSLTLAEALSRFEKVYLLNALKKNNWKRGPTADSQIGRAHV